MPLWQIDIYPAEGQIDRESIRTCEEISELGLGSDLTLSVAKGFLIQGNFALDEARRLADTLLCDGVTERSIVAIAGQEALNQPPGQQTTLVNVLPKPGVMDPVASSTVGAARDAGLTLKRFERCANIGLAIRIPLHWRQFVVVRFRTMR